MAAVLNVTLTAISEMKTLTPGFSSPKRKAERARAGLTSEDGLDQHVAAGLKDLHDSSRKGVPVLLEPSARVVRHLHTSHQPRHHLMVFTLTTIEYDPYIIRRIRYSAIPGSSFALFKGEGSVDIVPLFKCEGSTLPSLCLRVKEVCGYLPFV